jgi:hypothetical protein
MPTDVSLSKMNNPAPSSPLQPFPNLGNVITTDDVSQKGTGSYKADYVNWCRTMHLLHEHAPGWQFCLAHYADASHAWKAPNGTAYVVGYFTGPNGERTPDFPQAIMDNRNNAVAYEKVSARDLTDSHRRCLCTAAAAQFGLAWQLWAREEVENPHRAESTPTAKPAAKVEGVSDGDQPLSENDRNLCLGLIKELTPEGLASFCESFRRDFNLKPDAKVAPALTSKKHQDWMNANLTKFAINV